VVVNPLITISSQSICTVQSLASIYKGGGSIYKWLSNRLFLAIEAVGHPLSLMKAYGYMKRCAKCGYQRHISHFPKGGQRSGQKPVCLGCAPK
jgi:hypothetical protein